MEKNKQLVADLEKAKENKDNLDSKVNCNVVSCSYGVSKIFSKMTMETPGRQCFMLENRNNINARCSERKNWEKL